MFSASLRLCAQCTGRPIFLATALPPIWVSKRVPPILASRCSSEWGRIDPSRRASRLITRRLWLFGNGTFLRALRCCGPRSGSNMTLHLSRQGSRRNRRHAIYNASTDAGGADTGAAITWCLSFLHPGKKLFVSRSHGVDVSSTLGTLSAYAVKFACLGQRRFHR